MKKMFLCEKNFLPALITDTESSEFVVVHALPLATS